jgi:predicted Fe-S protein YdhL (DUF1289 family)
MDQIPFRPANVESPCIKVCALDAAGRYCMGCFRTAAEIGRWRDASNAEKRLIKAAAETRARAAGQMI